MSWRAIQDSVATSESLAALNDFEERLFWRLVAKSDAWGRLPGSPRKIKALCAPLVARATETRITEALDGLENHGRLTRYEVEGRPYCQLVDFDENQPRDAIGNSRGRYQSQIPPPGRIKSGQARSGPAESESESENKNKTAKAVSSDDVHRIFDVWVEARGKARARLTEGRRTKIKARLRHFPAAELIRAIKAVALDPWEDRPRHDDLTVIFRNDEQVERFLGFADSPPENGRRGLTAAEILALPAEEMH